MFGSLALAAGVAVTALGLGAEAKANQQGLFGEVWFASESGLPLFFSLAEPAPNGSTGNNLNDADRDVFLGRIQDIMEQTPYGTPLGQGCCRLV